MLADNLADLQDLMNRIVRHSEGHGLLMNVSKTKLLVFSKTNIIANLSINDILVEQVNSFRYLGTIINNQCDPKIKIKARIEQARKTFINMKHFFTRRELSLELRMRMIRCYIFSTLLYGSEGWTLYASTEKKLDASLRCTYTVVC